MNEIDVFVAGVSGVAVQVAHAHGEAMLDTEEGVLVIHGKDARMSMTFNWSNVLSYTEQPIKEEAHNAV